MTRSSRALFTFLMSVAGCDTYNHLRSYPPACRSYDYGSFMGHSRAWVQAQNIPERWVFTGPNDSVAQNDPTRIAFSLDGTPEVVSGVGCN